MLKEIIPSKFKIVDGNCSGDSQSFNGLVVLNDYFCLRVCDIDTFNDCLFPDAIHNIFFGSVRPELTSCPVIFTNCKIFAPLLD